MTIIFCPKSNCHDSTEKPEIPNIVSLNVARVYLLQSIFGNEKSFGDSPASILINCGIRYFCGFF